MLMLAVAPPMPEITVFADDTTNACMVCDENIAFSSKEKIAGSDKIYDYLARYGIDTYEQVVSRFKYEFKKSVGVNCGGAVYCPTFAFIDCYNYEQFRLNKYYNDTYKRMGNKRYTGTCTEVAIAIATDLIIRKDLKKVRSLQSIFTNTLNIAIKNNWFPATPAMGTSGPSGTYPKDNINIFSEIAKYYGLKRTISHSLSNGYSILEKNIEAGYPVVISLPYHTVVGVGYQYYEAGYTVTTTYRFFRLRWSKSEYKKFGMGFAAVVSGNGSLAEDDSIYWIKNGKASLDEQDRAFTYLTDYQLNNDMTDITYLV